MKTNSMKNYLKISAFLLLALLFLKSCETDNEDLEIKTETVSNRSFNTVSFSQAKEFFNTNKGNQSNHSLTERLTNPLVLTPAWETLEHQDLYLIDEAQLTSVKVDVNRNGNYKSKLIFINVNREIKNVIYTIYEERSDVNGIVLDARIYLNEIDGTFIDGYIIKNRKFVKRYVKVKKESVQKAGFFAFFWQEDTEDEGCDWNQCGGIESDGSTVGLDAVDLGMVSGNNGGYTTGDVYSTISSWNNSTTSTDGNNYGGNSGSSGGDYSDVAGTIYANTVETEECIGGQEIINGTCQCPANEVFSDFSTCVDANELIIINCVGNINVLDQLTDIQKAEIANFINLNGCSEETQIAATLEIKLIDNPFLLIDIDCNQIQNWQTLAQHIAPQSVQSKIDNLPSSWANNFEIQSVNEANGTMVNLDYFSINVSNLPNNPNTNLPFTANELLDYMRRNFNDFVEGSTFEPYCEITSMCQTETDLWNSNNPIGSIIYIDIPLDDGVVVCTEYTNSYWYFMTMNAPYAGNHPVSGTRQFGYEQNSDGSYNFFVRGVDRFDSNIAENVAYATQFGDAFQGADNLWESFQNKTQQFINNNGGSSSIITPVKNRPDWDEVEDVLNGERPVSDLGCN